MSNIENINGIGYETINKLRSMGIESSEDMKRVGWERVALISHIGSSKIASIYNAIGITVNTEDIDKFKSNSNLNTIKSDGGNTISPRINAPIFDEDDDNVDFGDEETNDRARALAQNQGVSIDEIELESNEYNNVQVFTVGNAEFYVVTDSEADEIAEEYIRDTVWAFNASFINDHINNNVENIIDEYNEMRQDFQNALDIMARLVDAREELGEAEESLESANDTGDGEEIDEAQEFLEECEQNVSDIEEELRETGFDEDEAYEDNREWEDTFFDQLASEGIPSQHIFEFIEGSGDMEAIISEIQADYESSNDTITDMIDDMDDFIADAISSDGRGHFISQYDGEESEERYNGELYYIYRIN
jgi:hypothetical protein